MCLLVKGGCMSPLGKYYWISQPLQNPKIPSGSFAWRESRTRANFCQFSKLSKMQKKSWLLRWHDHSSFLIPSFSYFSVLRKEFEVPPYSQSVELGSQIQLRCHPPKGVPKPRVRMMICWLLSIGYAIHYDKFPLGLSKLFSYRFTG